MSQREVLEDILEASSSKTTNATSTKTVNIRAARFLEVWLRVTAKSGTAPTLILNIETSIDGTNFVTIASIPGITAEGVSPISLSRQDFTLGTTLRVSWVLAGGTPNFTFEVKAQIME